MLYFRHILSQFVVTFLMASCITIILVLALMFGKNLRVASFGIGYISILAASLSIIPIILFHSLPYVVFVSFLISSHSIFHNNELVSLKSFGLSYTKFLTPVLYYVAIVLFYVVGLMYIFPRAIKYIDTFDAQYDVAKVAGNLKQNTFNAFGKNHYLYFNKIKSDGSMKGVTIIVNEKDQTKKIIHSDKVNLRKNKDGNLVADCSNVKVDIISKNESVSMIESQYSSILLSDIVTQGQRYSVTDKPRYHTNSELLKKIRFFKHDKAQMLKYLSELHGRFMMLIDILLLILIGMVFFVTKSARRFANKNDFYFIIFFLFIMSVRWFILDLAIKYNVVYAVYCIFSMIFLYIVYKFIKLDRLRF